MAVKLVSACWGFRQGAGRAQGNHGALVRWVRLGPVGRHRESFWGEESQDVYRVVNTTCPCPIC